MAWLNNEDFLPDREQLPRRPTAADLLKRRTLAEAGEALERRGNGIRTGTIQLPNMFKPSCPDVGLDNSGSSVTSGSTTLSDITH